MTVRIKQSAAAELDACNYLYLEEVSEPHANGLRLVLSAGIVSDRAEMLKVGGAEIQGVHSVKVADDSIWFEVVWEDYISYSVRNESYCSWDEGEVSTGNSFLFYTTSKFLDFVSSATIACDDYPGPFVHYEVICVDHIIDVASEHPPTVRRVDA